LFTSGQVTCVTGWEGEAGMTEYPVIAAPLDGGAVQLTVAEPFPAIAVTPVGVPGTLGVEKVLEADHAVDESYVSPPMTRQ
jgi:hypothetical protein